MSIASNERVQLMYALAKIAELEKENAHLRSLVKNSNATETIQTKENIDIDNPQMPDALLNDKPFTLITNKSKPEEKLAIFKSLFRGREDIYALRWSGKDGKSGYSPACANDWKVGICGRYYKIQCSKCTNRVLLPFNDEILFKHLKGEAVVGVYPLLPNDTCYFLAIDFDKKEWQTDVRAFQQTCFIHELPAYIEISRSGNGAHLWIFFDVPVSAHIARKLGSSLLTATMENRHQIGLDSYDRLFPNQDTMPKGGFGNLIALPMQKEARGKGNSVFVDKNLIPYADQWDFLSRIRKVSLLQMNQLITQLTGNQSSIGNLRNVEDMNQPPWDMITQIETDFGNLPNCVQIVISNMIYIEKAGLSQKLLNRIMRIAAFSNPEYYKAQTMRLPLFDKPRVIDLSSESAEYIEIPRGCFDDLKTLFEQLKVEMKISDKTNHGTVQSFSFNGKLSNVQLEAGNEMLRYDNGVLSASTAFGKTVVALWMIAKRQTSTLIIVHRRQLMQQWKERIECFLGVHAGEIGAGKDHRTLSIDVAVVQSLFHKRLVKDYVRNYGMIIVDECHHMSAFTFEQVLKEAKARYVYGLTATPVRQDGQQPIVMMQCGPIRFKVDNRSQAALQSFKHNVIIKETTFKLPESFSSDDVKISEIYQALVEDADRNDLILDDIIAAIEEGRSPLILTERTAHVDFFAEKLIGFTNNIITLKGGMGKKQLYAVLERLKAIPENEERVIIATGKYIGEGFDDSRLDTLFLTLPISWKGTLQQYAGRLHRKYDSKTEVRIYDYVDHLVPMIASMFKKRKKGYEGIGYEEIKN